MPAERTWLVSPVFMDVESYVRLREEARATLAAEPDLDVRFVAIDDTAGGGTTRSTRRWTIARRPVNHQWRSSIPAWRSC